jgi:hypothetical protein
MEAFGQIRAIVIGPVFKPSNCQIKLAKESILPADQGCQIFLDKNSPKREKYTKMTTTYT